MFRGELSAYQRPLFFASCNHKRETPLSPPRFRPLFFRRSFFYFLSSQEPISSLQKIYRTAFEECGKDRETCSDKLPEIPGAKNGGFKEMIQNSKDESQKGSTRMSKERDRKKYHKSGNISKDELFKYHS